MTVIGPHLDLLSQYQAADEERAARDTMLELLRSSPTPFARTHYHPGHLTASGFVLSPDRRRGLVVWHARLAHWLQPGGHVETADATAWDAAAREVAEETGVRTEAPPAPVLLGVDMHEIPAGRGEPAHLHLDLCFLLYADSEEVTTSAETPAVAWWPFADFERSHTDTAIRRYARQARAVLEHPYPETR